MFTSIPEPSLRNQFEMEEEFETPAGEAFKQGILHGIETTSYGIAANIQKYWNAGEADGDPDGVERTFGEEEWKTSDWFREGLTYQEGLTPVQAEMLATRFDKAQYRRFLWDKSKGLATAAFIGGEFAGAIIDPVNFIPLLSVGGVGAKIIAKLGARAGRTAVGAAEAAGGAALFQPAMMYEGSLYQEDYDLKMAATSVAMAAGIGAGFGMLAGALTKYTPEQRVAATSKALADMEEGLPVNVSEQLPQKLPVTEGLQFVMKEGPEIAPHRARKKDAATPSEISETAEGLDMLALAKAQDTPVVGRTAEQQAMLDSVHLTDADARALELWSTPVKKRSADDKKFLEAYKNGTAPEYYQGQLATLEKNIKATKEFLKTPREAAEKAKTEEALNVLEKRRDEARAAADELKAEPMQDTVAQRPHIVDPETVETTKQNLGEEADPDEIALQALDARFADLEADGLITPEGRSIVEAVEIQGKEIDDIAKATELAGLCIPKAL